MSRRIRHPPGAGNPKDQFEEKNRRRAGRQPERIPVGIEKLFNEDGNWLVTHHSGRQSPAPADFAAACELADQIQPPQRQALDCAKVPPLRRPGPSTKNPKSSGVRYDKMDRFVPAGHRPIGDAVARLTRHSDKA
jgi:hypothetical protein